MKHIVKQQILSVIIPTYNEEQTILPLLKKVFAVRKKLVRELNTDIDVIVVNDGSTDKTRAVIESYIRHNQCNPLRLVNKSNEGKGSAVRNGLREAVGNFIIIQDADLEYSPNDYPRLLAPLLQGWAVTVYGSRFIRQPLLSKQLWAMPLHFIGNQLLSLTTSVLYGQFISDIETCYKCFRSDIIQQMTLNSNDFTIEAEITAKLLKKGIHIHEVAINYSPRSFKEGKKITWRHGFRALFALVKYRMYHDQKR